MAAQCSVLTLLCALSLLCSRRAPLKRLLTALLQWTAGPRPAHRLNPLLLCFSCCVAVIICFSLLGWSAPFHGVLVHLILSPAHNPLLLLCCSDHQLFFSRLHATLVKLSRTSIQLKCLSARCDRMCPQSNCQIVIFANGNFSSPDVCGAHVRTRFLPAHLQICVDHLQTSCEIQFNSKIPSCSPVNYR